jgi:rubrerythrin
VAAEKQGSHWDLGNYQNEEIFQVAVTIEQGGYDFYSRLIEATDNQRVKNEMKFLRDEERKHRDFFKRQLAQKGVSANHKISRGLEEILEKEFLKPMKELYSSKKITKNVEALRFGVDLEQKTIDFYSALKEQQDDPEFLRDLDVIIEEEKNHKTQLNIILSY